MNIKKKVIDWFSNFKFKIKNKILTCYSSILYEEYYDQTYKNQHLAAALICLIKKRFWLIVLTMFPTLFFFTPNLSSSPVGSLYVSLNAAGIFYIVFNLYPEVQQSFKAAKLANSSLNMIRARRAWLVNEITEAETFTEANRYLTKDTHIELVKKLQSMNGYKATLNPNVKVGKSYKISYSLKHPLYIDIMNQFHLSPEPVKNLLEVCNVIARDNLRDIKKIKSIPNIEQLVLYDSLIYLEEQMKKWTECSHSATELMLVAYLIQAVDKINYYAQMEMPLYVGLRYDLKFKPTKDEKEFARKLVTLHLTPPHE
ncbi:hypothetical protein CWB76_10150 [Pseudoalteromonas sp. S1609]|uniref:hypothetical protein n=1 Tax=Pseudoalteromonas sp. S1609 TaxID=579505 RepID=UPI00110BD7F6|nr:hypothetical protein [Pseudoalteromonas sp. S1609]TMP70533.1 hypothetical protein CWB76_10150 [Pseudoalteromonas sp. S1609]